MSAYFILPSALRRRHVVDEFLKYVSRPTAALVVFGKLYQMAELFAKTEIYSLSSLRGNFSSPLVITRSLNM